MMMEQQVDIERLYDIAWNAAIEQAAQWIENEDLGEDFISADGSRVKMSKRLADALRRSQMRGEWETTLSDDESDKKLKEMGLL